MHFPSDHSVVQSNNRLSETVPPDEWEKFTRISGFPTTSRIGAEPALYFLKIQHAPGQRAVFAVGFFDRRGGMDQINTHNVKDLQVAWTFSTGVLHGHEGAPLVVDGMMYVHSPYPNNVFAINLDDPGTIVWEYKPKQNPAARAVACCNVVNRGLAYTPAGSHGPAKIFLNQLDAHVVALNAESGELIWKLENSDIAVGSTLTQL
jgi:glucose dehydrogenase